MKELHTHLNKDVKTELNVKKQQEIEYVLEGTIIPKKGHFVWEININTSEIKKAEYKQTTTVYNIHSKLSSEKLIVKTNCIYISALNAKNAKIKYLKNKNQSAYYKKIAPMSINEITF